MSNQPEPGFDLENLLLPAWAQQPPDTSRFARYEVEEGDRSRGRGDRGPRWGGGDRRDRPPRREGRPGEGRGRGGGGPGSEGGPGRRPGPPRGGPGRGESGGYGRGRPGDRREQAPPPPPPLDLQVSFVPEEKGVESLARQIRLTGRAYPLFDVAQLVLKRAERFVVEVAVRRDAEGKVMQPLWVCSIDETVWLSADEALRYVLRKHFEMFYQAERTPTEPPKGTYTFVAQCGLSGVVLGPPNYHDYQNKLTKLHAERFSRMPFDMFKSRVRIVRDPEVVKKWIDDQSWKTEYVCLNVPEPLRLTSREAVEQHFREVHAPTLIREVDRVSLITTVSRDQSSPQLLTFLRRSLDDQRRFPLRVVTTLSQQFASHGLQFFKVNKTVTHVAVARPRYLDLETTPVSDGVRKIVEFIHGHPGCTRRKLLEAVAPAPNVPPGAPAAPVPPPPAEPPPAAPAAAEPVPTEPAAAEPSAVAETEGQAPAPAAEGSPAETSAAVEPAPQAPAPAPAPQPVQDEPTPEQTAVISDLHWLIHQGHVIEFAKGTLELAKKPTPKPPRPEPKPAATPEAGVAEAPTAGAAASDPAVTGAGVESPALPPSEGEAVPSAEPAGPAGSPAGTPSPGGPEGGTPEAPAPMAEVPPASVAPEAAVPAPETSAGPGAAEEPPKDAPAV